MSIQCDTDSAFTMLGNTVRQSKGTFELLESYDLEISSPSSLDGMSILYSVSDSTLIRLIGRILEEQEVIVGLVGYDLYKSVVLEILSQLNAELKSLFNNKN